MTGPTVTAARTTEATQARQAREAPSSGTARGFLRALGIAGWDALEPAVLAALATESPLLLIGGHGSAKTLLLARLVYLETPATIWQAEAVLFEVSRCRPELQNKLFPLVHEKLAQGLPLPRLKHRWTAMNPPPADGNAFDYEGAEPLDVALADRFPFVLEAPTLDQLSEADRRAVLLGQGRPDPDAIVGWIVAADGSVAVISERSSSRSRRAGRDASDAVSPAGLSPRRA